MSDHKTLHEALRAVQSEVGTLPKDATNPHFRSKFTPLDTIVEHVGPVLSKHGLTWQAFPCFGPDGQSALRYKVTHAATGECESEVMPLLVQKPDPQGMGSAITYARRYSLTAVLNLVSDEDDDGNSASRPAQRKAARPVEAAPRLLTAEERDRMLGVIADTDQNEQLLFSAVGVSSIDEVTTEHARKIRALIDKAVAA